jgi:hypothetical protein
MFDWKAELDAHQAAAILGVTVERVNLLCASGELPAHPSQRGKWRIHPAGVRAMLRESA